MSDIMVHFTRRSGLQDLPRRNYLIFVLRRAERYGAIKEHYVFIAKATISERCNPTIKHAPSILQDLSDQTNFGNHAMWCLTTHLLTNIVSPVMTRNGMSLPTLVLGTASKSRRTLFVEHFPNVPFRTATADIDERAISVGNGSRSAADPAALTLAIAHAKADALAPTLSPGSVLLTSDQVVTYAGAMREKPVDKDECRDFLRSYKNAPAGTVGAVVVTRVGNDRKLERWEGVDSALQYFLDIPEDVIEKLLEKGYVMYCAGGITVEDELLIPYLGKRVGSKESLMGLPVELVTRLLRLAGLDIEGKAKDHSSALN